MLFNCRSGNLTKKSPTEKDKWTVGCLCVRTGLFILRDDGRIPCYRQQQLTRQNGAHKS